MWRQLLIMIFATTTLASCGGSDIQPKSGKWINAVRDFLPFQKLSVNVPAEVIIEVGSKRSSIELGGDQAVVDAVSSDLKDGTLVIDAKGKHLDLDGNVPLKISVMTPKLDTLNVFGAGNFDIEALNGETFDMSANGACSVKARGAITKLNVTSSGASDLDFGKVECKDVKMILSGASKAKIDATESLDINVSGASSVRYTGNPKRLDKKVSGVSKIEPYSSY
jgi:hypothetical protein